QPGLSGTCSNSATACIKDNQCGAGTCSNPSSGYGCWGTCVGGTLPGACLVAADCGTGGTCTGPAPGVCSTPYTLIQLNLVRTAARQIRTLGASIPAFAGGTTEPALAGRPFPTPPAIACPRSTPSQGC